MTKSAASSIQQLLWRFRLLLELRPPVPEAFQWKPVRLTILSLIQIAPPPSLMMRSPERFKLDPIILWPPRHYCPPRPTSPWNTDRNQPAAAKCARNGRLPQNWAQVRFSGAQTAAIEEKSLLFSLLPSSEPRRMVRSRLHPPPTSLHAAVVAARVARKAPQWGLSFVERPPENGPGVLGRANSPDFLWAMMVEWSFVMQDDQLPKGAVAGLPSVEIRTATSGSNPDRSNHHGRFET
jgi:hypothetical protein